MRMHWFFVPFTSFRGEGHKVFRSRISSWQRWISHRKIFLFTGAAQINRLFPFRTLSSLRVSFLFIISKINFVPSLFVLLFISLLSKSGSLEEKWSRFSSRLFELTNYKVRKSGVLSVSCEKSGCVRFFLIAPSKTVWKIDCKTTFCLNGSGDTAMMPEILRNKK